MKHTLEERVALLEKYCADLQSQITMMNGNEKS